LIILDNSIDAPPSLIPKKKYCDITGYEVLSIDLDVRLDTKIDRQECTFMINKYCSIFMDYLSL